MSRTLLTLVFIAVVAAPLASAAQGEPGPDRYFYATYFNCQTDTEDRADELVNQHTAPIFDAAVDDGAILGWGWQAHHTGGQWRRIRYYVSDSMAGLLTARETVSRRADAGDTGEEFSRICPTHDDYIWQVKSGTAADTKRAIAAFSVYHVCSIEGEDRVDEIVEKVFAPVYNKAVAEGKIKSWGWSAHVVGGQYRRLSTMTATSFPELVEARAAIMSAIHGDGGNAEANEFTTICTSHADYLWEVLHEKSR